MSHNTWKRLIPACCAMELCWLCAWANFLAVSTTRIRFPIGLLCAAFLTAMFLASVFKNRKYRIIWLLLLHLSGLGLMISAALFAGMGWTVPVTPYDWYEMILIAAMVCLFWYKGKTLAVRQMSYSVVCNHFDLGLSLFFALLLIKLMIQVKGGIQMQESLTLYSMGGYFLFGLAAVFFSHHPIPMEKQYLKGFHMYGALISGCIVLLFCSMAAIFVLLPFMTSFAASGYSVLKQVAGPLYPYLITILRFIFSVRRPVMNTGAPPHEQTLSNPDITLPQEPMGWAGYAASYGMLVMVLSIALFVLGYVIHIIYKFLMSEHSGSGVDTPGTQWLRRLIRWLVSVFATVKSAILALTETVEDAKKGFDRLVSWGRKSGMPRFQNETPAEYAKRLGRQFVPLENEIKTIVHAFHLEIYGENQLNPFMVSEMVTALKIIHSPSFWFLRIKSYWKRL